MGNSKLFAISACTIVLAGVCACEAFAGEVKGPPGPDGTTTLPAALSIVEARGTRSKYPSCLDEPEGREIRATASSLSPPIG